MGPYLEAAVRAAGGAEAVGERAPSMLWSLGGVQLAGRMQLVAREVNAAANPQRCFSRVVLPREGSRALCLSLSLGWYDRVDAATMMSGNGDRAVDRTCMM